MTGGVVITTIDTCRVICRNWWATRPGLVADYDAVVIDQSTSGTEVFVARRAWHDEQGLRHVCLKYDSWICVLYSDCTSTGQRLNVKHLSKAIQPVHQIHAIRCLGTHSRPMKYAQQRLVRQVTVLISIENPEFIYVSLYTNLHMLSTRTFSMIYSRPAATLYSIMRILITLDFIPCIVAFVPVIIRDSIQLDNKLKKQNRQKLNINLSNY